MDLNAFDNSLAVTYRSLFICKLIEATTILTQGALDKLKLYSWPGNVRELENVVERELIQYSENTLNFKSFIKEKLTSTSIDYNIDSAEVENKNTMNLEKVMSLHINKVLDITGGKIHGAGGAAELLNINPNTLRARMKKLGIL
ncbi:hypothetical protein [Shewanella phaeophyticola]